MVPADTAGKFEDVETVTSGSKDIVYAVVKRNLGGKEVRTIEYFTDLPETDAADDYIMLDGLISLKWGTGQTSSRGLNFTQEARLTCLVMGCISGTSPYQMMER